MATDATGAQQWTWKRGEAADDPRLLELLQLGMGDSDIATELGCNRSTVFRARKRFIASGQLAETS